MADVRLNIAGREYLVTCRDGEEDRLKSLGAMVNEKAQEAGGSASGLNESRQLLFASLLLADKLADSKNNSTGAAPTSSNDSAQLATATSDANAGADNTEMEKAAETLEKLADRMELIAQKLDS